MFDIICRFCGKEDPNKFSCIFDGDPDENGITLLQKIGCFIPITVSRPKVTRCSGKKHSLIFRSVKATDCQINCALIV